VLRTTFVLTREEVIGGWEKLHEELHKVFLES
jgi:hypothetical protein